MTVLRYLVGMETISKPGSFEQIPSWLLGDHLGSTSMVTDASGGMVSEVRYSAFGETRYQNGTLTTDYLYTGQRQEAEIGLYYYVARWYDPAIGRFIQADSVVPDAASALGFDRYAYVNNNPLKYVDPSGHCPQGVDTLTCLYLIAIGRLPDFQGINTAEKYVTKGEDVLGVDATAVAAGIAVQSQWYRSITDSRDGWLSGSSSGLGIAQIGDSFMMQYFPGQDQEDPYVAVQAMAKRISIAIEVVTGLFPDNFSNRDRFITAALAQNGGGFTPNDMQWHVSGDGTPDWGSYFNSRSNSKDPVSRIREILTGRQFDTQFQLLLFINDVKELNNRGWDIPFGLSTSELNDIQAELIEGLIE